MFPERYIKRCYLEKQLCVNYSGFYQGPSGYYMVLMNYFAALMLTRKFIMFHCCGDCGVKTRSSKAKVLI